MKHLLIILFLIQFIGLKSQEYYYFKDEKIEIKKLTNKAYLQYSNFKLEEEKSFLSKEGWEIVGWNIKEGMHEFESLDKSKTSNIFYEVYIESKNSRVMLPKKANILYAEFYFEYNNSEIAPTQLFYVQLKDRQDIEKLKELAAKQGVELLGFNKFMPEFYTLRVKNAVNSISVSRTFYETGFFVSSEPNFVYVNPYNCTNDPQFGNLWGLRNTGQSGGINGVDIKACNAWNSTTGNQNIIVAVIDNGVELTHSDLVQNLHPLSFNAINNTSPSILSGLNSNAPWHGTHCAGTIGAVGGNSLGVVGVAPNIRLMSINVQYGSGVEQILANGINLAWQNGASVLNNSWGGGSPNSLIQAAISNALNNGRNGAGSVVVFSSGNNNSSVSSPANNNPDIIVVGSNTRNGNRSSFSNFGSQLDIVAPGSDIVSTILNNNFGSFSGTSMAAPHVSGVAALILSVNPCLSQKAVHDIICKSGQKIGGVPYNLNTRDIRLGSWNNEMGHGLVNAEFCLQLADNFYLQKNNENGFKNYLYRRFEAGANVDPSNTSGDYTVDPNADVTLRATESITLKEGFHAKAGSRFYAKIEPNAPCNHSNPILKMSKVEIPKESETNDNYNIYIPQINAFPNPTKDIVKIEFETKETSKVQIFISDIQGKNIFTDFFNRDIGKFKEEVAGFQTLKNGTYILKTCVNNHCQTFKIIKDANQ
ncbi:MAG: S8 family peptidase [Flavobacterium sp.]|jgi:subtilisin family serine protease|nr:S8 family peptidase [Flavobacterium sp.]